MKNKIIITAFVLMMALLLGAVSVSGKIMSEIDPDNKYKYEEIVIPKVFSSADLEDPIFSIHYYSEGYEYYSPENTATGEEATPDYVVINVAGGMLTDINIAHIFGDYVLYQPYGEFPFEFGRGVFIPKTGEVYDLIQAYDMKIEGIENVFTEAGVGRLIGDMDKDRALTVKDATYIQKCLAGIIKFDNDDFIYGFIFNENPPLVSVSDFNRDGERNIKDATAIQKHIAGLSY